MENNQDTTVNKFFSSFTELTKNTTKKQLFVRTHNNYFINVSRKSIKQTADCMTRNKLKFEGEIVMHGQHAVQITIN